jgi:hypothetical protein
MSVPAPPSPPPGSAITVAGDRLVLAPRGLSAGHLVPAVVGTGLVAFGVIAPLMQRTRVEAQLALIVAVPLLVVGLLILTAVGNTAMERQELELGADRLIIRTTRRLPPRTITIPWADIDDLGFEVIDLRRPGALTHLGRPGWEGGRLEIPVIEHAGRGTHFAQSATRADARWIVATLQARLAARRAT